MSIKYSDHFKPSAAQQNAAKDLLKRASAIGVTIDASFDGKNLNGVSFEMDPKAQVDPTLITADAFVVVASTIVKNDQGTLRQKTFSSKKPFISEKAQQPLSLKETLNEVGNDAAFWDAECVNGFVKPYVTDKKHDDTRDYYLVVKSSVPSGVISDLREYAEGKTWGELKPKLTQVKSLARRNALRLLKQAADHYHVAVHAQKDSSSLIDADANNGAVPFMAVPTHLQWVSSLEHTDDAVTINSGMVHYKAVGSEFLAVDGPKMAILSTNLHQTIPESKYIPLVKTDHKAHIGWNSEHAQIILHEIKSK